MIEFYSEEWKQWRDPEIPEYFNPTVYLLDRHLDSWVAQKAAVIADDTIYNYEVLLSKVCQAACALTSLGMNAEQRMLFFCSDSIEFVSTWLGAVRCGVVPAAVSDLYKASSLLNFLLDTAARTLFIDEEQVPKLMEIRDGLPSSLRWIIVRGDPRDLATGVGLAEVVDYNSLTRTQPASFEPLPRHANDVAYMFYSGGTTGTAKGITHLAHDFLLVPERHGAFWNYEERDIVLATSKKYFTHGLWPGLLIPLYWGATSIISRQASLAEWIFEMIERHHATKLITVPTVIKNLIAAIEESGRAVDFSSLRLLVSASEKMPREMFEKFRALFGIELLDSIGSSEVTYEWIANRPKEFKPGSLGRPVFGYEIKLMDPEGNEVNEPGCTGEAWVKSRTACFYYWRKFDLTKETFVGQWVRTGDTLYFDEDGFFWFSGRSDDLFKVKGLWVSPIEVEAAITEHPAVHEAAVVPYEDSEGLVKPKAFVVVRPGQQPSAQLTEALQENARRLGGYKVPEVIEYLSELPRTTLLKIDRRALRKLERARKNGT